MKQRTFERYHQQQWESLETWLAADKKSSTSAKLNTAVQFPQLYRQVCQHLALARDRHYTPQLIERLNRLVLLGHQQLYRSETVLLTRIITFIRFDFPRQIRREFRLVWLSGLLFFGVGALMFIGIQLSPKLIYTLFDAQQLRDLEAMYSPSNEHFGRDRAADSDFFMFGYYIRNNIGISFQVFAGGIVFGIGTIFFLVFNGLFIGGIAGHLTHLGYIQPFYTFVIGHSALELTAIVIAGVGGLKLGMALIAPGRLNRLPALRHAAIEGVSLIYGIVVMLVLAAFLEAFWSSNAAIAPIIKYTVGSFLWFALLSYFTLVGRDRAS
jgi:uncharacterized membrane protein SpoIIM required for sporulation